MCPFVRAGEACFFNLRWFGPSIRLHPWAGREAIEHCACTRQRIRGVRMNKTQKLHDLGQSLWLDNITRFLLDDGTLRRYIDEFSITGLTSNPTIFNNAIGNSSAYDNSIRTKAKSKQS